MRPDAARSVRSWLLMLWAPNWWFAHFNLVYAAASLELTFRPLAGLGSRVAIGVLTVAVLAIIALPLPRVAAWSPGLPGSQQHRLWVSVTRMLIFLSAVAVVYQALPALMVP